MIEIRLLSSSFNSWASLHLAEWMMSFSQRMSFSQIKHFIMVLSSVIGA